MADQPERYFEVTAEAGRTLSERIARRMEEVGIFSQAELVRRSDVSHPTVRALMKGAPGKRQRIEARKVSVTLGWEPTAIETLVLDGDEPKAAGEKPTFDERLTRLEDQMERVLRLLEGLDTPQGASQASGPER